MTDPSPDTPDAPLPMPFGDALNDVPLFREIQRVLLSSTGPVNWELARQVGIATAAWGSEDPSPTAEEARSLSDTVRAAELAVANHTGLSAPTDVAEVRAVRRAQWVEANVRSLKEMLDPVAAKLGSVFDPAALEGLGGTLPGMGDVGSDAAGQAPEMMGMLMQRMAPLLLGAQVGTVLGYLSQQVLGQFDLAVPRDPGVLLFVVPNIARFESEWSLSPVEFRAYVALHEVTHRFEFARSWVQPHFLSLVRDLVEHAVIDLSGLQQRMEGMDLSDPQAMSNTFEEMGNFFGRSDDPEQRLRIARVQAFLAAAEGYGDHVMRAVGRTMLSSHAMIEEAMLRHLDGRHGDRALERLLGLEMKQEQYRLGEAFCAKVTELTDEATLARMWDSAESLPSMPELEEPSLWLSRMA